MTLTRSQGETEDRTATSVDPKKVFPALEGFQKRIRDLHLLDKTAGLGIGDVVDIQNRFTFTPLLRDARPGVVGGEHRDIIIRKLVLQFRQVVKTQMNIDVGIHQIFFIEMGQADFGRYLAGSRRQKLHQTHGAA